MQLDELGQWIDPGPIDDQIGLRATRQNGCSTRLRILRRTLELHMKKQPQTHHENLKSKSHFSSTIEDEVDEPEVPEVPGTIESDRTCDRRRSIV